MPSFYFLRSSERHDNRCTSSWREVRNGISTLLGMYRIACLYVVTKAPTGAGRTLLYCSAEKEREPHNSLF